MAITMAAIIFLNFHATPIIRLLIRVISDLKVTCNCLADLNEILCSNQLEDGKYITNWRMANTMVTIIFQNSYATPLIRLSLRLVSDLKVTCNYLLDLN